jgi:large repetitive protein
VAGTVAHLAVRTPTPTLSVDSVSVLEGNAGTHGASFTVTLALVSNRTVSVDYRTADETATEGSDYVGTSGTLTFAPRALSTSVRQPASAFTVATRRC